YCRAAVCAHGIPGQVDSGAAVGTVNRLHVLSQLVELLGRQRPDELLLSQKIDECNQAPVAGVTSPILKPCAALQVVCQEQLRPTPRAAENTRERGGRRL